MNPLSENLRRLRLARGMTQEQAAQRLGVSAQSVSRWETAATMPDVLLLPEIARLYGVLVDELFRPDPRGYANNAIRLLAVFEHTHKPEDFLAAAQEFGRVLSTPDATADDWRSCGVAHEYMVYQCIEKAAQCYARAMDMTRGSDPVMYHRTRRQSDLLRSRIGQGAACIAEAEEAVRLAPDDADAWADLAHALQCTGEQEKTLRTCEEGLTRFPDCALLHLFAGDAARALKRYDCAFTHWETTLRLDDTFTDAMYSMAFCREELGQFSQAADAWDAIVRKLEAMGLEIEAKWPREMAEKCHQKLHT